MSRIAKRCLVAGRVQGVFYRASTREQARALGIEGHALNLPDGRVEVLMVGSPEAVERLEAWLWEGPSGARVTEVVCETVPVPEGVSGFRTGWGG